MRLFGREIAASRSAVGVGLAVVAGLALGVLLVPRTPAADDPKAPPPPVELLGRPLVLDDSSVSRAVEAVRRHVTGAFTLLLDDDERVTTSFGELGVEIDKLRLGSLVRDARDPTSPLRRAWRSMGGEGAIVLPVPLSLERERALKKLLAIKDSADRVPVDARLDLEKKELVKETYGRLLDVDATLHAIERALERGEREARASFEERRPRRVSAELGDVRFDHVLGWFETRYNRAQRYEARTYNLRLAASKLDGHVLLPGEIFDFNEVVGPRDEASGYKVAPVIAEGELVDGIGGGTCQISGTLHGAAFFAGLEIVERYPHTRPSSYIKMGLDATVVYPTITFRVKNPFDHPVVLHQTVKNGVVRAEVLGPPTNRTVTLIRKIDEAVPYEEVERPDASLPEGTRILSQRGIPGFKLHRYRIVRRGSDAVRERWSDVYPPTPQIVRVGSGPAGTERGAAADDPHPEYVADELLVATQGASPEDGSSRAGAMTESREPGRFGRYGWTETAGMPFWRGGAEAQGEGDDGKREKGARGDGAKRSPAQDGKPEKGAKGALPGR